MICPRCGKRFLIAPKYCPRCSTRLDVKPNPAVRPEKAARPEKAVKPEKASGMPTAEMVFPEKIATPPLQTARPESACPSCGKPVSPGVNFCTACGTRLSSKPVEAVPSARAKARSQTNRIRGIMAIVLLVFTVISMLFNWYHESKIQNVSAAVASSPPVSFEEPKKQADQLLASARSFYKRDDYREALATVFQANDIFPSEEADALIYDCRNKILQGSQLYWETQENVLLYGNQIGRLFVLSESGYCVDAYIGIPSAAGTAYDDFLYDGPFCYISFSVKNDEPIVPSRFRLESGEDSYELKAAAADLETYQFPLGPSSVVEKAQQELSLEEVRDLLSLLGGSPVTLYVSCGKGEEEYELTTPEVGNLRSVLMTYSQIMPQG
jgi:hypothetical protein